MSKKKREEKLQKWEDEIKLNYAALRKDLEGCYPDILGVCRQLYREAAQIMYGGRTFGTELDRDTFHIFGREFRMIYGLGDYKMLESQLRHMGSLRLLIDADEDPCGSQKDHNCSELGCSRKRMDGIRNLTEFLAGCIGLTSLEIHISAFEYFDAAMNKRNPTTREIKRLEGNILHFIEPFGNIRDLVWSEIYIGSHSQSFSYPYYSKCSLP